MFREIHSEVSDIFGEHLKLSLVLKSAIARLDDAEVQDMT